MITDLIMSFCLSFAVVVNLTMIDFGANIQFILISSIFVHISAHCLCREVYHCGFHPWYSICSGTGSAKGMFSCGDLSSSLFRLVAMHTIRLVINLSV